MSNTTKLPELLTCGCCFADIQTIAASLYHVGYTEFNCGEGGPTNTDVKYLKLQKQGIGTVTSCGGWAVNKKNLTQTWTVDRFTGKRTNGGGLTWSTCYNGDKGTVSYLCGTLDSCTATQINYKCGPVTEAEKENFCTEENFEKTAKESLSNPYTLEDVADDVDASINAFNFSNPKGTFGTVQFGTNGNKVLQWSASGGTPESRFTYLLNNQGVRDGVYKQKSRIKILKDGFLTKVTELEGSSEIIEETIEVTKNQIIILEPPEEPGRIYFIPYCTTKYLSTNIKTSCSGSLTTKTAPPPKEGQCVPSYWIGPDCKQYNTRTEKMIASSKSSSSSGYSCTSDFDSACSWPSSGSGSGSSESTYQYTKIERIGPNFPNCYSQEESLSGSCSSNSNGTSSFMFICGADEGGGPDGIETFTSTNDCSGTLDLANGLKTQATVVFQWSKTPWGDEEPETLEFIYPGIDPQTGGSTNACCIPYPGASCGSCDISENTSKTTVTEPEYTWPDYTTGTITTTITNTKNQSTSITDNTYTCVVTQGNSETISSSTEAYGGEESCEGGSEESNSYESTFTVTFSNEGDDGSKNWKTETSSNCNSCGSWYVTHDFESKRTATVSMEASFQAPDVGKNPQGNPNPPKNYITYVQRIRREDDTKNPDCLGVTYISDLITHNSKSSGGEIKVPVPSITLKTQKDLSDCLVHVSAITFEVE